MTEKKMKDDFDVQMRLSQELEQERARKRMFDDMHDHLGADLLDLVHLSKSMQAATIDSNQKENLEFLSGKLSMLYQNLRLIYYKKLTSYLIF
jgi:signal transduction histidine kinase